MNFREDTDAVEAQAQQILSKIKQHPAAKQLLERIEQALPAWEAEVTATQCARPAEITQLQTALPIEASSLSVSQEAPSSPEAIIEIWCDGSCSPNPGPGGWGLLMVQNGERAEWNGHEAHSTNNRMELTAALEGLKRTQSGAQVQITTDSRYLKDGMTKWIRQWKRRGWRKADGEPVLNQALWQALDAHASTRHVEWNWTKAHAGNPENERCDQLANEARQQGVSEQ